ncbi:MAG TPA: PGPGW domain-containing protein [Solirubrobacteraceae bacterium]|nr:PGPGW domain-containing protein [Solirubrobacteraceae bacterium]
MTTAPERDQPERPGEPALVRKLRARQKQHKQRGRLYRWAFVLLGLAVLAVGVAMLALPGPAFVVIPIGLAILSLEFVWAERLLEKALVKGEEARRKAAEASPAQKALSAVAIACACAAALAAALLWDIPYVPV